MKVLAIGNSFSTDATTYLHDIAAEDAFDLTVANLYIGGCSLASHWENIFNNSASYLLELNGRQTERMISIKEALEWTSWDYVTMQQYSGHSGLLDSYCPHISNIHAYVKECAPKAIQMIHQTWAYEIDAQHEDFPIYDSRQDIMYQALKKAYESVAKNLKLDIIPCGDIIQAMRLHPLFDYANGGQSLCRDGYHMHSIYGRYLTAAVWYEVLTSQSILSNEFLPVADGKATASKEKITAIKQCVHTELSKYKS